ncbi:hypothetical protein QMO56_04735 [Roseomonas sp. E05]|uniref:cell division protein FtsL n=1 Tax=Roseomonas sp. E05 TaxID=3046310 RepID=UPI0024BA9CA3|nr:hypothetical protein [Roseomonas sp. E05]MDJ0387411.1 hypothetical protein [Roseomonas sp. E05]
MFRPLTVVAITAFSLVGWHVYRAEEAATQLDRELRDVTRRIEAARERTQVLRAEWAMLNEPERLRQMAQKHLPLETMTPSQFLRLADLERRLPAPVAFAGPVGLFGPAPETAVAAAEPAEAEAASAPVKMAAAAAPAPVTHAAPPAPARPVAAAEPAPRPAPRHVAEPVTVAARRAEPAAPHRPIPAPREAIPVSAPSRLGAPAVAEARPVPRPEPNLLRASAHLPMGRAMAAPAVPMGSALGGFAGNGSLPPPVPMAAPVPVAPGTWSR